MEHRKINSKVYSAIKISAFIFGIIGIGLVLFLNIITLSYKYFYMDPTGAIEFCACVYVPFGIAVIFFGICDGFTKNKWIISIFWTLLYFHMLLVILLLYFRGNYWFERENFLSYAKNSINIIPFKTIYDYVLGEYNFKTAFYNIAGNIFLFIPVGFYASYVIKRLHKIKTFLIAFIIMLLCLETLQLIIQTGIFDIDDFLLNLSGAVIGYYICKVINSVFIHFDLIKSQCSNGNSKQKEIT